MIRLTLSLLLVIGCGYSAENSQDSLNEKLYAAVIRIKSGEADFAETLTRFKEAAVCLPSLSAERLNDLLSSNPPMTARDALSSLSAEWAMFQDAFKDDAPNKTGNNNGASAEIAALRPVLIKEFTRLGFVEAAKPKVGDLGVVVLTLEQDLKQEEAQKIIVLTKEWVGLLDAGRDEEFIVRCLLDGIRFKNEDAASRDIALKSFKAKRDGLLLILNGLISSKECTFSRKSAKVISVRFTSEEKQREVIIAVGGNGESYRISSFK